MSNSTCSVCGILLDSPVYSGVEPTAISHCGCFDSLDVAEEEQIDLDECTD